MIRRIEGIARIKYLSKGKGGVKGGLFSTTRIIFIFRYSHYYGVLEL
jgi:hypothetical protein